MPRSGARIVACTAACAVVAVVIIKRDAIIGSGAGGILPAHGGSESHASRFARGAPIVPIPDDISRKLGAASTSKERKLTPCPRDTQQDTDEELGGRMLQTGSKRAERKNGQDDGEPGERRLQTGSKRAERKSGNDEAVDAQSGEMQINSGNGGRNRGESIAESFARNDLQFRDPPKVSQMKAQTSQSETSGFPYKYPAIRYVPWAQLSEETRDMMQEEFGYDEERWNHLGSHNIEGKMFSELNGRQMGSLLLMGIDEDVWDCFVNHYSSYHRNDLIELGVYDMAVELWNVRSSKKWDDLSGQEVEWATRLCYSEEVWNQLTLGTW